MGQVARLAVPAFFTLIAEPLFLLADSAIVGHLGTTPLAALGVASTVLLTLTGVFVFLAYATTAVVARAQGAGNRDLAISAGLDGMWLALIIAIPLAIITAAFAHPLAAVIGGSELAGPAATYLRISALGLPAMLLSLALQGLLRGLQDTRTPLWATTIGFAANTALNAVLVLGMDLDLAGSAIGTALSQWLLCLMMLTVVLRRAGHVELKPHLGRIIGSAKVGTPLLIRTLALRAVLLLTTAAAAKFGTGTMAAHQIINTVFSFLSFALDALAIAAQAMTGEALGRGDRTGVRSLTRRFIRMGWVWGIVAAAVLLLISWFLPMAFTGDPDVRRATFAGLAVLALVLPLASVVFVLDGVLMGAGDGVFLAKAQVVVLTAYLPFVAVPWLLATHGPSIGHVAAVALVWAMYDCYLAMRYVALIRRSRKDDWMRVDLSEALEPQGA